ncbi:LOW QUALITY PROTEIN: torsin-1A-interacting protein 2-like [Eleginops maclovinus]|uniref:LOW QUALITY PROTEIN: torsin-1A-interacting protein 2-like n=1 Tax=Eleginops maclovinus TaxID=56733 RepID=UPI003080982D
MAEQDPAHHHTSDSASLPAATNVETNNSRALNQPLSEEPRSPGMAEQHTDHHHIAEGKGEETKAQLDQVITNKRRRIKIKKAQLSQDSDAAGDRMAPAHDDTTLKVAVNRNPFQADERSCGDYNRETPGNEQLASTAEEKSREHPIGEKKESETTTPPTLSEGKDDQVDGPKEESSDTNNTHPEAGDNDESIKKEVLAHEEEEEDIPERRAFPQFQENVETVGPSTEEPATVPVDKENTGGIGMYLILGFAVLLVAIVGQQFYQPELPRQKNDEQQIDIFLRQLGKVKTQFPNQREVLWSRSKIHLLRHLQTAQPTEPVSLILTAGHGAERTLHCLAQSLATAFSTSINASVLHIDGASKASQDSDQVKLDIDSKLQGAFEGDKPVAVINRFEELPPGSTLIFYRYCDHENAAYKKTCLIFTVLLGEEEEIPAEARLSAVEEMVDDHLQKKFLSDGRPVAFDRMDLDKYGGLWSRISHLILPVAAERRIELAGC